MRFEIPQFIDIEDKIFGPLTWRQFVYLGGGVGMGVVLFLTTHFIVFVLIGLPLAVIAGALAFYPVNNRPFSYFLQAIYGYLVGKKLYLWQRKQPEMHVYKSPRPLTKETPGAENSSEMMVQDGPSFAKRLELQVIQKEN